MKILTNIANGPKRNN